MKQVLAFLLSLLSLSVFAQQTNYDGVYTGDVDRMGIRSSIRIYADSFELTYYFFEPTPLKEAKPLDAKAFSRVIHNMGTGSPSQLPSDIVKKFKGTWAIDNIKHYQQKDELNFSFLCLQHDSLQSVNAPFFRKEGWSRIEFKFDNGDIMHGIANAGWDTGIKAIVFNNIIGTIYLSVSRK